MTEAERTIDIKAELVTAARSAGRPVTGELAVRIWEFSTHAPVAIAKQLMSEAGYELWVGYPLQRCTSQR